MPKILAIAQHFDRCEAHILAEIARSDFTIEAVADPAARNFQSLHDASIMTTTRSFQGRIDIGGILFLRRLIRQRRPDIIHFFSNRALTNGILATLGLGIPLVAYRGTVGHLSRFDPLSWLTYLYPGLSRIICVSEAVRQYLLTLGVPEERAVTIHKGHDVSWYYSSTPTPLANYGVPSDAFVVACVANMRPVKGVAYLVEALRLIPKERKVHLLLVGDLRDDEVTRLAEDPSLKERVHFTGFLPNVADVLVGCHAFIMPSVSREGLPKALLEAMALKLPSIGTSVGGIPELITHGESGILVPPRDPEAIAHALLTLSSDPAAREALGRRGYETIRDKFDYRESARKTREIYRSLSPSI